jgi:D-alanine-D-alanine ligase
MKIAVVIGEKEKKEDNAELQKVLELYGNTVQFVPISKSLFDTLTSGSFDMILNLAGKEETDYKPAQYTGLFDLTGVPFALSGVDAVSLCKNKALFKPIIQNNLIPTPNYQVLKIYQKEATRWKCDVCFPVVIKIYQVGIKRHQMVDQVALDQKDLNNKLDQIIKSMKYSYCMVEQFVFGPKIFVPIIGNELTKDLRTLSPVESPIPKEWDPTTVLKNVNLPPELKPMDPNDPIAKRAVKLAEAGYLLTNCRDYAIASLLLDRTTGNLMLHEINPIPVLYKGGIGARIAEMQGISYENFINTILLSAMKRYEIKLNEKYQKLEQKK